MTNTQERTSYACGQLLATYDYLFETCYKEEIYRQIEMFYDNPQYTLGILDILVNQKRHTKNKDEKVIKILNSINEMKEQIGDIPKKLNQEEKGDLSLGYWQQRAKLFKKEDK